MTPFLDAITDAFRSLRSWHTIRRAFLIGIVLTVFWAGIGYLLWKPLVQFGSHLLEWIPFSMVRANGAWMATSFIWLQLVLVTFALVITFVSPALLRSDPKKDTTSSLLMIMGGSALFWGAVWLIKADAIYQAFMQLFTWLPFETLEKGIAFLLAFYLIYNAIVVSTLFATSLMSRSLLADLDRDRSLEDTIHLRGSLRSIRYTIRDSLLFLAISLLLLPLLFVPVLDFLIQLLLWMWLIKETLSHDTATLVYENVEREQFRKHRVALWGISFLTALFFFVPLLNFFGPLFGEIAMYRYWRAIEDEEHSD